MLCFARETLLLLFSSCSFYLDSLSKIKGNEVDVENSRNILFLSALCKSMVSPPSFKKSVDVSNYIILCRVHIMLDVSPVYKSYLLSPLDLMSFNGFCFVVC